MKSNDIVAIQNSLSTALRKTTWEYKFLFTLFSVVLLFALFLLMLLQALAFMAGRMFPSPRENFFSHLCSDIQNVLREL
jgi:hypothetical protein